MHKYLSKSELQQSLGSAKIFMIKIFLRKMGSTILIYFLKTEVTQIIKSLINFWKSLRIIKFVLSIVLQV